jgi:hypothetical protein
MAVVAPDLSNEWDKAKLRNWMSNAKRHDRDDIYQAAFRQLCRIDDPLESEFAVVMRALEEALSAESGTTKRLSRTRQKLNRVGVRQTLADLAMKPTPSTGFLKLVEFGMARELSAEALVLKYESEFEPAVVEAAKKRLAEYNL